MSALGDAWGRIKYDLQTHPGTWLGVGVSAAVLVVAYMAYTNSQSAQTPANGYGSPDWANAASSDSPAAAPTNQELQNEIQSILAYLSNPATPNPPTVSAPTSGGSVAASPSSTTTGTASGFASSSPASPIRAAVSSVSSGLSATAARVVTAFTSPSLPTVTPTATHIANVTAPGGFTMPFTSSSAVAIRAPAPIQTSVSLPPQLHTVTTTGHGIAPAA